MANNPLFLVRPRSGARTTKDATKTNYLRRITQLCVIIVMCHYVTFLTSLILWVQMTRLTTHQSKIQGKKTLIAIKKYRLVPDIQRWPLN